MTKVEAAKIVGIILFNYPNTLRDVSDEAYITYIENWHSFFVEDRAEEVLAAVQSIIASSQDRFAPNIGMIREQMRKLRTPKGGLSEQEAWELVKRALRNGSYGYREEFAKLPPTVQRCVGSENMIREWAAMETETLDSVVASNFMRSYRAIKSAAEENDRMSPGQREALERIFDRTAKLMSGESQTEAAHETAKLPPPKEPEAGKTKASAPPPEIRKKIESIPGWYTMATEAETEKMKREQLAKLDAILGGKNDGK